MILKVNMLINTFFNRKCRTAPTNKFRKLMYFSILKEIYIIY